MPKSPFQDFQDRQTGTGNFLEGQVMPANMTSRELTAFLRKLLNEKGITKSELATRTGRSVSSVHALLDRDGPKKVSTLLGHLPTIAEGLDTTRDEILRRFYAEVGDTYAATIDCLEFERTQTLWYLACGTGERGRELLPTHITLAVDSALQLNPRSDFAALADRTLAEDGKKFENNSLFFLHDAEWHKLKGEKERPSVTGTLGIHKYALFYALTRRADGRDILFRAMQGWVPPKVVPELSLGIGVSTAIISQDDKFIFSRRRASLGPRPEQLDIGSVEGLSVAHDVVNNEVAGNDTHPAQKAVDVDRAVRRALNEEYAFEPEEVRDLHILGFGYDLEYAQWNFLAVACVTRSSNAIQRRVKRAAHLEYYDMMAVEAEPKAVFETIANDTKPVWSCGIATAYFAMVHKVGVGPAEKAADALNLRPIRP